jgi:hypothetical protein
MTNLKALATTRLAAVSTTLFENPELTAMAAICDILKELPDDPSRLRVMHWAFGRFNPEFKRQAPASPATVAALEPAPAPAPRLVAVRPLPAPVAPVAAVPADVDADFGRQISELRDMFPGERHDRLLEDRSSFNDLF